MIDIAEKKDVLSTVPSPPDCETGIVDIPAADSALTFLRNEAGEVIDVDERTLVRKIDFMILP